MIAPALLLALTAAAASGHGDDAGKLPVCGNRVIGAVVKRVGCTLGDARCWLRSGGFCTDHVEQRLVRGRARGTMQLNPVRREEVRPGDVAQFSARAHYAYVEAVIRDGRGKPLAVELSEFNFGTCWVDKDILVTDQYKVLNRRSVSLADVDGGFLRARPAGK
jgi:hypothetical protein